MQVVWGGVGWGGGKRRLPHRCFDASQWGCAHPRPRQVSRGRAWVDSWVPWAPTVALAPVEWRELGLRLCLCLKIMLMPINYAYRLCLCLCFEFQAFPAWRRPMEPYAYACLCLCFGLLTMPTDRAYAYALKFRIARFELP